MHYRSLVTNPPVSSLIRNMTEKENTKTHFFLLKFLHRILRNSHKQGSFLPFPSVLQRYDGYQSSHPRSQILINQTTSPYTKVCGSYDAVFNTM